MKTFQNGPCQKRSFKEMEKVSYSIPYFCLEYKCVRWTFVWKAFCKGTDSIEL